MFTEEYSDKELLEELNSIKSNDNLTVKEFSERSEISPHTYIKRFGSWNEAKKLVGKDIYKTYDSKNDILNRLKEIVEKHGYCNERLLIEIEDTPSGKTVREKFGSIPLALSEIYDNLDGHTECVDCAGLYQHYGKHISQSECTYPNFSDYQKELIIGSLLGDAYISKQREYGTSSFNISMINSEFIYWLSKELEPLSNEVVRKDISDNNRKDMYQFCTVPHRYTTDLREWYSSGQKRFPEELVLTPVILKMWYVTDGGRSNGYPRITTVNESDRVDYLLSLFTDLPFDVSWDGREDIQVSANTVSDFYEYIGEPVPGFEYKWP